VPAYRRRSEPRPYGNDFAKPQTACLRQLAPAVIVRTFTRQEKLKLSGLVLVCVSRAKRGLFSAGILLPVCSAVARDGAPKDPSHIPDYAARPEVFQ
jgi:hypothetical protein